MRVALFRPAVDERAVAAAAEVMRSGWIGMGPKVAEFERAFGEYLGLGALGMAAVAVNTGTAALHVAVRLLKLERGAEIITTANTFVATNQVMLWEGLRPVFADIDPATGNIDPAAVAERITGKTAAIMAVHFGGMPCDLDALQAIARKHGVPLVEDCAHACGASLGGKKIGASGNLCAFSFGPTKALTTIDGGMLIVPEKMAAEARAQRLMGMSADVFKRLQGAAARPSWDYDVPAQGRRYHMHDVAAAMGLAHLALLDEGMARRAAAAERYGRSLEKAPGVRFLKESGAGRSAHYLYVVLAENRDGLARKLQEKGVTTAVYYKPSTHYAIFGPAAAHGELPGTEQFFGRALALPMHAGIRDEEIDYVCGVIREGW